MRNMTLPEIIHLVKELLIRNRKLKAAPYWSYDRIQSWQFARIKKIVRHAFENTTFYNKLYSSVSFNPDDLKTWDDFSKLPIVTKDDVINNFPDGITSRNINMDDVILSRSSGSSGKVLDIVYDLDAFNTYILAGLRLYNMGFNYRPWHTQAYIYTSPYPMSSLLGMFPLKFLSTLTPVPEVVEELVKIKPALLVCYPSHLKQIAQYMRENAISIHPKFISVNSEMSTQKERDDLSAFFACPVLDEYSSEELTRIAAQCKAKKYHIFEDINYMETVDDNNAPTAGLGTLIGTNLHNFAMPMIRYKQNDLGRIVSGKCDCKWNFREMQDLQGRKNDSFVMPSGKVLHSGLLLDLTYDFLLDDRDAIIDFCLIQKEKDLICLEIVKGRGWNDSVREKIVGKFRSILDPGVVFEVMLVDECVKTKTGKRNPIINMLNRK